MIPLPEPAQLTRLDDGNTPGRAAVRLRTERGAHQVEVESREGAVFVDGQRFTPSYRAAERERIEANPEQYCEAVARAFLRKKLVGQRAVGRILIQR